MVNIAVAWLLNQGTFTPENHMMCSLETFYLHKYSAKPKNTVLA